MYRPLKDLYTYSIKFFNFLNCKDPNKKTSFAQKAKILSIQVGTCIDNYCNKNALIITFKYHQILFFKLILIV